MIEIIKSHNFRLYLQNTSWMVAEQFFRVLSSLIIGIWVARYLGPELFGIYSFVIVFFALCSGFAKLGLDGVVTRELVNNEENYPLYLGTAFRMKLFGALGVILISVSTVPFLFDAPLVRQLIMLVSVATIFQSFDVIEYFFLARVSAKFVAICKVVQLTLSGALKVVLIVSEAELIWFIMMLLFDAASLSFSYVLVFKRKFNISFFNQFDKNLANSYFQASYPLLIAALATMLYTKIDQLMLKSMLGYEELGIYSASVRIFDGWMIFPVTISVSVLPFLIQKKYEDRSYFFNASVNITRLVVVMSLLFALFISLAHQTVIHFTFGKEFYEMKTSLIILVWMTPITALGSIVVRVLLIENMQKKIMARTIWGLLLNIMLNLFLIPIYGINGAAFASFISVFFIHLVINCLDQDLLFIRKIMSEIIPLRRILF